MLTVSQSFVDNLVLIGATHLKQTFNQKQMCKLSFYVVNIGMF